MDADVRIRPGAPDVFGAAPPDVFAAVDEFASPTREDYAQLFERLYQTFDARGIAYKSNRTPQEYHSRFGLENSFDSVVQTGVMVYRPRQYSELLRATYDRYEDKGAAAWNYEMRPVSHEVQSAGPVHWLSPKFNMVWACYEQLFYPFLSETRPRWKRLLRRAIGRQADASPDTHIGWAGQGHIPSAQVERHGRVDFATPAGRELIRSYDFLLTCGRSDPNPTTILEAAAWGLVPVATLQSGYYEDDWLVNIPLDNVRAAVAVLVQSP